MDYPKLEIYKCLPNLDVSRKLLRSFYNAVKLSVNGDNYRDLYNHAKDLLVNYSFRYLLAKSLLDYFQQVYPEDDYRWLVAEVGELKKYYIPTSFKVKASNAFVVAKKSHQVSKSSFGDNKKLIGRPISVAKRN